MAFSHGSKAVFKLTDASAQVRTLTSYLTSVGLSRMADAAETTVLGISAKQYIAGMTDGTIPLEGPFDPTVDGYMDGLLGYATLVPWEYYPAGEPVGATKPKYTGNCMVTAYDLTTGADGAAAWTGELQLSGTITRAVV